MSTMKKVKLIKINRSSGKPNSDEDRQNKKKRRKVRIVDREVSPNLQKITIENEGYDFDESCTPTPSLLGEDFQLKKFDSRIPPESDKIYEKLIEAKDAEIKQMDAQSTEQKKKILNLQEQVKALLESRNTQHETNLTQITLSSQQEVSLKLNSCAAQIYS